MVMVMIMIVRIYKAKAMLAAAAAAATKSHFRVVQRRKRQVANDAGERRHEQRHVVRAIAVRHIAEHGRKN